MECVVVALIELGSGVYVVGWLGVWVVGWFAARAVGSVCESPGAVLRVWEALAFPLTSALVRLKHVCG